MSTRERPSTTPSPDADAPDTEAPERTVTQIRRGRVRRRMVMLAVAAAAMSLVYQFAMVTGSWDYVMDLRSRQLAALVVVGIATGVAALMFQTITHNRILTPNVMGFDALYRLVNTLFVWVFGSAVVVTIDAQMHFIVDTVVMTLFGVLLYRWILRRTTRDLFVLVLIGIVMGALFTSLTLFASRLLSPDDFLTLQDLNFTSFNTVDPQLLTVTAVITALALAASVPLCRKLDVIALGRDSAVTLGIEYRRVVDRTLIIVTILVATSTALVGPMTFVGLIVANLARSLFPTYRHSILMVASALFGIVITVGGQFVAARLLDFTTTLSVVVNLIGGVYFIWLLLRETDL